MIFLVFILLFTSVYFSARFFLLSKNIQKATYDLQSINKDIGRNHRLTLSSPDKHMEELLYKINDYLEISQMENIKNLRKENEIRKEIENISHDLRTPLTSILGYLQLMQDEDTTEEEKAEYISIIERKSKYLQHLIQTFYDMSRLQANDYKLDIKSLDVNKKLMEQLLLFYNDFEEKNINVGINLGSEEANILCDEKSIERIFNNLISNATKYSKSTFKVNLVKINDKVEIIFKNDVYNLDSADEYEIFKPFYTKDKSRHDQSSGLGLTVAKLLIEAMNGSINCKINNDGFIEFRIILKLYETL
ncbi:sensor histidine kinase [Intestinibacter sp.]